MSKPTSVSITLNYATLEDAFAGLQFACPPAVPVVEVPAAVESEKKARKPRSDAGQARGSYKTSTAPQTAGGQASAEPSGEALIDNALASGKTGPSAAAVESDKVLTLVDVRAAMEVLNKKHGIEANMKQLAAFGVQRASELSKDKYGDFIAAVRKAAE